MNEKYDVVDRQHISSSIATTLTPSHRQCCAFSIEKNRMGSDPIDIEDTQEVPPLPYRRPEVQGSAD